MISYLKNSISIDKISYNEMMELSHYGANIIYNSTILPLYNKRIPIIVKNTFNPEHPGTKHFENTTYLILQQLYLILKMFVW